MCGIIHHDKVPHLNWAVPEDRACGSPIRGDEVAVQAYNNYMNQWQCLQVLSSAEYTAYNYIP